ncbi:MAG: pancreas/duodenum homeobox protein 1 [Desulfocapsaceae bacterium]|nr:pancreas/duodenum homeobox protein 1 [Desulfocapsaceae bacterium]
MNKETLDALFSAENLQDMFPEERSNAFFEALFGDADEGAYDIKLAYIGTDGKTISMELQLYERPGRCLACNLTHGLPTVFSRHPVINIKGVVQDIDNLLAGQARCADWSLGYTKEKSRSVHAIPLTIRLEEN